MKDNSSQWLLAATLLGLGGIAQAQSAGTWMVRASATTVSPDVTSGDLSAPSFPGTKSDVDADTQLGGGISYMYTDNISVDLPLALPFKHKINGAGAIAGVGQIGSVEVLPMTVFLQYRFLEAGAKLRPYVGLGATYAYFFNEEGSGRLTALTNPGGPPTKLSIDSKFVLTPQIGATLAVGDKWFVDVFYSKSMLSTKTTLSTGQTQDIALDPDSYGIAVGYKF
ncbi:MAG: OmpW family protein [Rhodoferax sp.]|uniref:OmpW/AlkL family protein n=1 Tax=Rhodoferax sp. TaxID=50421 RepID=UPI0014004676|nr:OmpW family outer membrane protein [Rhodoferax sp.]NDP40558.1 OmpW family protein [Rhodoferax sp.]